MLIPFGNVRKFKRSHFSLELILSIKKAYIEYSVLDLTGICIERCEENLMKCLADCPTDDASCWSECIRDESKCITGKGPQLGSYTVTYTVYINYNNLILLLYFKIAHVS